MNPDPEALASQAEAERDQGQLAQALETAAQAWQQLAADDAPARRRVGLLLVHLRYRSGQLAAAVDQADALLPVLRASGPASDLIDTLRLMALCAADTGRYLQGMGWAQEAHRLALAQNDPVRTALTLNALACLFERTGDPWQAERLMVESLAMARATGDGHAVRVGLNNVGAALIGRFYLMRDAMPLDDARACLKAAQPYAEEGVALARHSDDVFYRVLSLGNLGEILVHLGDAAQASALLTEALGLARPLGFEAQVWRLGCSQGELSLVLGQPQTAWDQLTAVLAAAARADPGATHMRLHHALWRAAAQLGRTSDALDHLQHYLRLERHRSVAQLQAQSDLFVTRMEAEELRQEASRHRSRVGALEVDLRRDHLTGLGNRRELEARWPEVLQHTQSQSAPLSVAMLDLDNFKRVNDQHGHAVGDQVLVALAGLLRSHTRARDLVVRLGGEEFLLILPDTDADHALEVCERLRLRVAEHAWSALADGLAVTLSIGLASAPPAEPQGLSLRADSALYQAKQAGRNRVVAI